MRELGTGRIERTKKDGLEHTSPCERTHRISKGEGMIKKITTIEGYEGLILLCTSQEEQRIRRGDIHIEEGP